MAATILTGVILVATADRLARSYRAFGREKSIAGLVAESEGSESTGRLGDALAEIEAALSIARGMSPPSPRLDDLRRKREELSAIEARERLAALDAPGDGLDPALAVGEALTLLKRASSDPALAGLVTAIDKVVARHRERWASAETVAAREAFEAGDNVRAIELCRRVHENAGALGGAARDRRQAEAEAIAGLVVRRCGVVVEPARGKFTLGSFASYEKTVIQRMTDALRARGYLPQPSKAPWPALWEAQAPFRLTFEVTENQEGTYLESPNRVSRIEGRIELRRGTDLLWSESLNARTEVPLPRAPAYVASRVAVSAKRSPDFERLLYNNAREVFAARIGIALKNVPDRPDGKPDAPTASFP